MLPFDFSLSLLLLSSCRSSSPSLALRLTMPALDFPSRKRRPSITTFSSSTRTETWLSSRSSKVSSNQRHSLCFKRTFGRKAAPDHRESRVSLASRHHSNFPATSSPSHPPLPPILPSSTACLSLSSCAAVLFRSTEPGSRVICALLSPFLSLSLSLSV